MAKKKAKKSKTAKTAKKTAKKRASRRETISPNGDKRYIRRGQGGRIAESDDVSSSLASDRRTKAKKKVKRGQGDRGDR